MGGGCGKEAGAVVAPPAAATSSSPAYQEGEPPIAHARSSGGPPKDADAPAANRAGGGDLQSFCDEFQRAVDERQLSATANTVLGVASSLLSKIVALDLPFPVGPLCNLASGVVGLALSLSKNFEEARQLAERVARVHFTVIDVAQRGHLEAHARAFGAILTNCRAVLEEFKLTSAAAEPTFLERVMGVAHSVSTETSAKIAKLHVGLNELSLDTALSEVLKVVPAMEHMHRQVMDAIADLGGSLDKLAAEAASANNVAENVLVVRVVVLVRMQERIGDVSVLLQGSKLPTLALPAPMEDLVQTWASAKVLCAPSVPVKGGRPVRKQPQVLIVEGGGGSGKSHFIHGLVQRAWESAPTDADADGLPPLPMFMIPMQAVTDPTVMVATALRRVGVGAALEQALKKRPVLFVLDALDEWPLRRLLFTQTDLQDWPNAHVLATTRPEFLETWGVGMLLPSTDGMPIISASIGPQRLYCVPFGRGDITRYVDAIAEGVGLAATAAQRMHHVIASNHGLITLCANPFVLSRVASMLAVDPLEAFDGEVIRWTRQEVYRRWLAMHWRRETMRLQGKPHTDLPHLPAVLESLQHALVMHVLRARAADPPHDPSLAAAVADVAALAVLPPKERFVWDDVLRSMPLRIDGDRYAFVHETVLEYLTSELPAPEVMALVAAKPFSGSDRSLIGFLAERVADEPPCAADLCPRLRATAADTDLDDEHWLRKALWGALQPSSQWPATANALTVLVVAKRRVVRDACFDGLNLEGAILDGAIFQRCTFRNCNLRNVAYYNVRTFDCNFAACDFHGATFDRPPMRGHTSTVRAVVFSPDGSTVASCSDNGSVLIWDAATRVPLHFLHDHTKSANSVCFSPDGSTLASCSDDTTLRVWDVSSGATAHVLQGHEQNVNIVCFSPDGSVLASCSDDKTVRVWDASTGGALQVLQGHLGKVTSMCYSPDGTTMASASDDRNVRVWDTSSGLTLHELRCKANATSICFSPDGKTIATGCYKERLRMWDPPNVVRVWDASTGIELHELLCGTDGVVAVCFSPDGKTIASSSDNNVRVWDASSGTQLNVLEGHGRDVTGVSYSPDGRTIASCGADLSLRFWDASSGTQLNVLEHDSRVTSLCFSPDGKTVATCNSSTICLWDVFGSTSMHVLEGHTDDLLGVCFSPDDRIVATASEDSTVRIWDAATGAPLHLLEGHTDAVNCVSFSHDGSSLASASSDGTVHIWDSTSGTPLTLLRGHKRDVLAVCFSPDDRTIASAGWDSVVRVWDASSGLTLQVLEGHTDTVRSVCFSPDGRTIASAGGDNVVRIWDASSGLTLQVLEGHTGMKSICFSPDGSAIASCNHETVRLWDVNSGAVQRDFAARRCICFGPDGRTLASFGNDKTLRVWMVASGEVLQAVPFTTTAHRTTAALSHDGLRLASGEKDLMVWELEDTDVSLLWVSGQRLGKHVCCNADPLPPADMSAAQLRLWKHFLLVGEASGEHCPMQCRY